MTSPTLLRVLNYSGTIKNRKWFKAYSFTSTRPTFIALDPSNLPTSGTPKRFRPTLNGQSLRSLHRISLPGFTALSLADHYPFRRLLRQTKHHRQSQAADTSILKNEAKALQPSPLSIRVNPNHLSLGPWTALVFCNSNNCPYRPNRARQLGLKRCKADLDENRRAKHYSRARVSFKPTLRPGKGACSFTNEV